MSTKRPFVRVVYIEETEEWRWRRKTCRSALSYYFGLYFLPNIVGAYLGYRGVKEYNEMVEQII